MEEKNKEAKFDILEYFANLTNEDIERNNKAKEQSEYTIKDFIDDLTDNRESK